MSWQRNMVNGGHLGGLSESRSGAAAAEFAMMLPLLLLLMFGTLQVSMLMFAYNSMFSAARDTARAMAVCTITDGPSANTQAQKLRPPWLLASDWVATPVFDSDVSITITVNAAKAAIINYLPIKFGSITAKVVMKREPLQGGTGSC